MPKKKGGGGARKNNFVMFLKNMKCNVMRELQVKSNVLVWHTVILFPALLRGGSLGKNVKRGKQL